jgi:FOG: Zn-finger
MSENDSDDDMNAGVILVAEEDPEELRDEVKIKLEPDDDMHRVKTRLMRKKSAARMELQEHDLPEKVVGKEGGEFVCLLCDGDEKIVGDMKGIVNHLKGIHSVRIYICDICGQDFRKRNELSIHLDDHVATEEGDFQCEVCNRIFSNLRLFRVHKRMHYPQAKLWTCETCGKRYSSRNLLDEHINTHTGIRPYVCDSCGKDFASKYTFKAHTKTHEVRPRPYSCAECGKTFLSAQNLSQHERTHTGMRNYVCDQCGKAFGTARNLEVHSVVHSGYKPFICRTCGKAFARKAEIRDHERTHTGEKPYQCEFCGATFSQRSNLQSHKRATHYQDKRHKCEDCGKGFKRRRLLDYHVKAAHTGERPYKCPTCDATFVYPEHFKKHRRIHTGNSYSINQ